MAYALHADLWHAIRRERTIGDVTWCTLWLDRSGKPGERVTGQPPGKVCAACVRELEHATVRRSVCAFDDSEVTAANETFDDDVTIDLPEETP